MRVTIVKIIVVAALAVGSLWGVAEALGGPTLREMTSRAPVASKAPTIEPPGAVKRAGGRELHEFKAGAKVFVHAGCLACHRIGESGKSAPGPPLTHIGSRLSRSEIVHFLKAPAEPMPSFKDLPKDQFRAVANFLRLLR
jgi:hypothetical protein